MYPFLAFIFPGTYYGQSLGYFFTPIMFGTILWTNIRIPRNNYSMFDIVLLIFRIYVFYMMGLWSTASHMLGCNIFYTMNIIGDHDTYEVSVDNRYEGKDWFKLQVQNSANFKTNCPIYTYMFGGINYQIEHHLFPSVSNSYYSQIAPLVKQFCKEHDIYYVEHKTLMEVFHQYYKTLKYYNK